MKSQHHSIFQYNKITEFIYLGNNACCQMHFNDKLLKKGIKADISLEGEQIDQPIGVEYFLWLPTTDHKAPSHKQLRLGVVAINNLVVQKIKIYIHCQNGHGRAPTLVASYLMSQGMSAVEAVSYIKKRRPEIHPNKFQLLALKKYKSK